MHNLLSDMDLQTRPLKSRCHFLAMTSRTIRVPLRRGSDERSHAIRLKVFSPLLLRQKAPTGWDDSKRRSRMVQMVRELRGCSESPEGARCDSPGQSPGKRLPWSAKPRRGAIAWLLRPFGAVPFTSPNTQGVALGYRIVPLRGFRNSV